MRERFCLTIAGKGAFILNISIIAANDLLNYPLSAPSNFSHPDFMPDKEANTYLWEGIEEQMKRFDGGSKNTPTDISKASLFYKNIGILSVSLFKSDPIKQGLISAYRERLLREVDRKIILVSEDIIKKSKRSVNSNFLLLEEFKNWYSGGAQKKIIPSADDFEKLLSVPFEKPLSVDEFKQLFSADVYECLFSISGFTKLRPIDVLEKFHPVQSCGKLSEKTFKQILSEEAFKTVCLIGDFEELPAIDVFKNFFSLNALQTILIKEKDKYSEYLNDISGSISDIEEKTSDESWIDSGLQLKRLLETRRKMGVIGRNVLFSKNLKTLVNSLAREVKVLEKFITFLIDIHFKGIDSLKELIRFDSFPCYIPCPLRGNTFTLIESTRHFQRVQQFSSLFFCYLEEHIGHITHSSNCLWDLRSRCSFLIE